MTATQIATFEAAVQFTRAEGLLPAPESAHAIRVVIDEALDAKQKGDKRVILFNLSGHGNFDRSAYQAYLLSGFNSLVDQKIILKRSSEIQSPGDDFRNRESRFSMLFYSTSERSVGLLIDGQD